MRAILVFTLFAVASSAAAQSPDCIDARPFGVVPDNGVDDTQAVQRVVDKAIAIGRGVCLPDGTININDTITIDSVWGFSMVGEGSNLTTLTWSGDASSPAILLSDCRACRIGALSIESSPALPLDAGIVLENGAGSTVNPAGNTLFDIYINGTNAGGLDYGVAHRIGAGGLALNSETTLNKVYAANYDIAAFYQNGSQAKNIEYHECGCNGLPKVGAAQQSQYCLQAQNGGFRWRGGGGGQNQIDVYIGNANDASTVHGALFEGSDQLLVTGGPSSAPRAVTLNGVRWTGEGIDASDADGARIVDFKMRGPLTVIGSHLAGGQDTSAPAAVDVRINDGGTGDHGFNFIGVVIMTSLCGENQWLFASGGEANVVGSICDDGTTRRRLDTYMGESFFRLQDVSAAPAESDCDNAVEYGRMIPDTTGDRLYVCAADGWGYVSLTDLTP